MVQGQGQQNVRSGITNGTHGKNLYQLPDIPEEVIAGMLHHMDLETLLSFRLTNRLWNKEVCSYLRKSPLPTVKFREDEEEYLNNYLFTLVPRIQRQIPFASYEITLTGDGTKVQAFLDVIGTTITTCTLVVGPESTAQLLTLVTLMPKLERLRVKVSQTLQEFFSSVPTSPLLPKLHTLQLCGHDGEDATDCIELEIFACWIHNLPALLVLTWEHYVNVESQMEFRKFLTENGHLATIAMKIWIQENILHEAEELGLLPKLPNVELDLTVESVKSVLIQNVAAQLTEILKKFTIILPINSISELPNIPNLAGIETENSQVLKLAEFWSKNKSEAFPVLNDVIIGTTGWDGNTFPPTMEFDRFETVKSLHIVCGFDAAGRPVLPFQDIFPNWRRRTRIFTVVSLLKTPTKKPKVTWALGGLPDLEVLEIVDSTHIKDLIIGLAALTHSRRIGGLKRLAFFSPVKVIGFEKLLFENCSLHKEVVFKTNFRIIR